MWNLFKNKKRITVTKDMSVSYLLRQDKEIRAILEDAGMHCVGCPSAMDETIEMACLIHGADPAAPLAGKRCGRPFQVCFRPGSGSTGWLAPS